MKPFPFFHRGRPLVPLDFHPQVSLTQKQVRPVGCFPWEFEGFGLPEEIDLGLIKMVYNSALPGTGTVQFLAGLPVINITNDASRVCKFLANFRNMSVMSNPSLLHTCFFTALDSSLRVARFFVDHIHGKRKEFTKVFVNETKFLSHSSVFTTQNDGVTPYAKEHPFDFFLSMPPLLSTSKSSPGRMTRASQNICRRRSPRTERFVVEDAFCTKTLKRFLINCDDISSSCMQFCLEDFKFLSKLSCRMNCSPNNRNGEHREFTKILVNKCARLLLACVRVFNKCYNVTMAAADVPLDCCE